MRVLLDHPNPFLRDAEHLLHLAAGGVRNRDHAIGAKQRHGGERDEEILIAVVDSAAAEPLVAAMRKQEHGRHAAVIGEVSNSPAGMVLLETAIGGRRIIDMLQGEQLPRIC